jgi:hypothetical protein
MKKIMTLALGLSFLTGTASLMFAAPQDKPADTTAKKKKMKKKKADKSADKS